LSQIDVLLQPIVTGFSACEQWVRPFCGIAKAISAKLTLPSDHKLENLIGEGPYTSMKDGLTDMAKWLVNWQPA